jgi:hypothetical protein
VQQRSVLTPQARALFTSFRTDRAFVIEASMFRISRFGSDDIIDVAQVDEIEPVIRSIAPGAYHVNEISADPLPSGRTSRRWGIVIKRQNGSMVIEPDPWENDVSAAELS